MNTQGLGKQQRKALEFIEQVNGWHTFAKDMRGVIQSLEARGLVEVYKPGNQFRRIWPISCDQCQMLSINGIACHETGCPNSRKQWHNGEWVRVRECRECGSEVYGDAGCCQEEE